MKKIFIIFLFILVIGCQEREKDQNIIIKKPTKITKTVKREEEIKRAWIKSGKKPSYKPLVFRTYDIIYNKGIIYRGTSLGLIVEKIESFEKEPQRLQEILLPGSINHLFFLPEYSLLFAFNGPEGFFEFKVNEDGKLEMISSINEIRGAAISGKFYKDNLIVAEGSGGLSFYKLKEGGVELLGNLDIEGYVRDIEFDKGIGYLALSEKGIGIINIESTIQSLKRGGESKDSVKIVPIEGEARDIELFYNDNELYLAVANGYKGITILKGEELEKVWEEKSSDRARVVKIFKNILLVGIGPDGILSYDISDPLKPKLLDKKMFRLAVIGITLVPETNYLLCAYDSGGLLTLKIDEKGKFYKLYSMKE